MGEFQQKAQSVVSGLEEDLDQILTDPQIQELKTWLENLDEKAVADVVDGLAEKMAKELGVTPEQLAKIGPTLRQEVEDMGKLLDKTMAGGAAAFDGFKAESAEIWNRVRDQLDDALSPEQLQKADALRSDLNARLSKLLSKEPEDTAGSQ
jgi:hypothetical protein